MPLCLLQADGLAWELADEVDSGFPYGLSYLGCAPRRGAEAASLLRPLAHCCLTACGSQRQDVVGLGVGQSVPIPPWSSDPVRMSL